jgi:hypothetical protein
MFVQTEVTPNPNSLKFIPGKLVCNNGSFEITKKDEINNALVRNLLSINGVTGIFLGSDFLSINKLEDANWEDIKHIVISLINDFYSSGKDFVVDKIEPISAEIKKLLADQEYLDQILLEGVEKANSIASKKIERIKEIVGF